MEKFCANIDDYHDNELSPDESYRMKEHLRRCRACADRLVWLRTVDCLIAKPLKTADRDISAEVMAKLSVAAASELTRRSWRGWWKVPVLIFASCVVYIICVETGLLPSKSYSKAAVFVTHSEVSKLSRLFFRECGRGAEKLLAIIYDGDEK